MVFIGVLTSLGIELHIGVDPYIYMYMRPTGDIELTDIDLTYRTSYGVPLQLVIIIAANSDRNSGLHNNKGAISLLSDFVYLSRNYKQMPAKQQLFNELSPVPFI